MTATRTPRVRLRAPTRNDQRAFLALVRESRSLHRPWAYPPDTPARYRAYLSRARRDDFRAFLVCRKDDGSIVGVINASQIVRGDFRSAYLGYWGAQRFRGQGLMTEGMRALLREAFVRMRLHRLEANVQPGNTASLALLARCGFRREGLSPRYLKIGGRWRDHERWALLREDWPARRIDPTVTSG